MRLFFALWVVAVALAQPLPFEKVLDRYTIGGLEFSPDGSRLAFVVGDPVKGTVRNSHIWQYRPATKELRQLTFSAKSETSPRWSPDGSTLAFTSTREEGNQIYVLPMQSGGEARPLTKGKASVQSFMWSSDGKQIAYLASQPKTEEQEKKEKDKDDARLVDHDQLPPKLWIMNADGSNVNAVATGAWTIRGLGWAADGTFYGIATTKPHSDRWEDSMIAIGANGEIREIARLKGPVGGVELSPDGKQIAYSCARVDGPDAHDLCALDVKTGEIRNLTRKLDRAVMNFKWQSTSELMVAMQNGFENQVVLLGLDGGAKTIAHTSASLYSRHPGTGAVASVTSSATEAPELMFAGQKVSNFNRSWSEHKTFAVELFTYKSFDGMQIQGGLLRPRVSKEGPMPLVVLVHGGPTGRWSDQFEAWGQLLASRGYAVFYPNPRGSTGYGFDFVAANRADWGFGDFKDIMAGVDHLIAQKTVDPKRMGIGGWSYGGYMSMWAVTQTDRFQCAVAGAGMSDLASEFGTETGSAYDEWFFGTPYEHLDKFQRSSPITYIKSAKTPSLILQGESDPVDPIGQSQQFYRALKLLGVPAELVVYPREGHGIREEKHMIDLYRRTVAWFEKYLGKN
jgi:dipeptidyl aminopeptidase/acylaminoacyl peptidase